MPTGFGGFFDVPLREQRGDGVFLLAAEFGCRGLSFVCNLRNLPRHIAFASLSDYQQIALACFRDQSDECHRHGKPWEREHLHENIHHRHRQQHHCPRLPQGSSRDRLGRLCQRRTTRRPDRARQQAPGRDLEQPGRRKAGHQVRQPEGGAERIWKAIQSLGEQAAAPLPETPFDAPGQEVAPAELP